MTAAEETRPARLSLRLSAYYFAYFAWIGVSMPYWPVWLRAEGLSAAEIGIALGAGRWIAVATTPLMAQRADRYGERKRPLVLLLIGGFVGCGLYLFVNGFWQILCVAVMVAVFYGAANPLGDSLTMQNALRGHTDYGRVRLWGSVGFILASFLGGLILDRWGEDAIPWNMLALAGSGVLAALCLPDTRAKKASHGRGGMLRLARHPTMLLFIAAMALTAASHAVLYAFGTIHWRQSGVGDRIIGLLWAEGVVAEIAVFAFAGRLVARIGVGRMIMIAGLAGVLRWTLLGASTDLTVLFVAQALHGLTFGAGHAAAMNFVAAASPEGMSTTGQGLYNAIAMGAAIALAASLCGPLFDAYGAAAYYAMAALSAFAALLAVSLSKRWDGRRLAPPTGADPT